MRQADRPRDVKVTPVGVAWAANLLNDLVEHFEKRAAAISAEGERGGARLERLPLTRNRSKVLCLWPLRRRAG